MISPKIDSATTYSADVRINLIVNNTVYPLSKVGPNVAVLRQPIDLPECEGIIELQLDNKLERWKVRLPHGACQIDDEVEIVPLTDTVPAQSN
ncbi:MAG: hypothetical protein KDA68_22925 [Planctomycetaceae bacterium]|nr:hypothetical protein [Planctomycetaceae bacterium]